VEKSSSTLVRLVLAGALLAAGGKAAAQGAGTGPASAVRLQVSVEGASAPCRDWPSFRRVRLSVPCTDMGTTIRLRYR
jgi:hypothetical protein